MNKNVRKVAAGLAVVGLGIGAAHAAAPAQPDVTDIVSYLTAATATVALVGSPKVVISAVMGLFRKLSGMAR